MLRLSGFVDDDMFSHNGLYSALCVIVYAYNSTMVPPKPKDTIEQK